MAYLTIRNVPPLLAEALEREKHRRRSSLNQTVISLLEAAVGLTASPRSNGLARQAGSWTAEDLREFESAIAATEQVDAELWE